VERLRELVSTVVGVRAVYYLQTGKRALEGGDWGGGFHDLSEGFGFVYSLQFTRQPYSSVPYLSATEVDGIIDVLTAGNGFWDITSETLDGLSDQIASRFAFSVAQAAE